MIRIAICDDTKSELDKIKAVLDAYLAENTEVEAEVFAYQNPYAFFGRS